MIEESLKEIGRGKIGQNTSNQYVTRGKMFLAATLGTSSLLLPLSEFRGLQHVFGRLQCNVLLEGYYMFLEGYYMFLEGYGAFLVGYDMFMEGCGFQFLKRF